MALPDFTLVWIFIFVYLFRFSVRLLPLALIHCTTGAKPGLRMREAVSALKTKEIRTFRENGCSLAPAIHLTRDEGDQTFLLGCSP